MKIDCTILTQLTEHCFDLSMDAGVPASERKEFLALGKRLRGSLLNLLTAEFEEGTAAVTNANTMMNDANEIISNIAQVLAHTAQVIAQIGEVVSTLDDLLKIATIFV
jgi:glutaredoxin 2